MNKYQFIFNADRCIKCWACEIACQQWKGIPVGMLKLRKVVEETSGTFPEVTRKFFSLSCRHCEDAPCADACPEEAITKRKEDGVVVVEREKCTGCHACLDACPYEIPQFDTDGKMQKCDMCLDRIENGKIPICVATCPTQALRWGLFGNSPEKTTEK
jgi:anaerobic dimethyl sulfoxide reductase subunit B